MFDVMDSIIEKFRCEEDPDQIEYKMLLYREELGKMFRHEGGRLPNKRQCNEASDQVGVVSGGTLSIGPERFPEGMDLEFPQ